MAIAYLIRRLEEGASSDNFMSALFELDSNPALLRRETDRFLASLCAVDGVVPGPNRVQDRAVTPAPHAGAAGQDQRIAHRFVNGFDDPRDYGEWFMDPAKADAYLAELAAA